MNLQAAAKLCGCTRQAIQKAAREGPFRAGGQDWIGRKSGKFWDLILARQYESTAAENGKHGGHGKAAASPRQQMDDLRARRLETQIKLDEQKIYEHDRSLRRTWGELLNTAIKESGSEFAGRCRGLRMPPELSEQITQLAIDMKNTILTRLKQAVVEWEQEEQDRRFRQ